MTESIHQAAGNGIMVTESRAAPARAPHWVWDIVAYLPAFTGAPALGLGVLGLAKRGPRILRERPLLSGLLAIGGAAILAKWQLERFFSEEPEYELEAEVNGLEIRRYPPRIVAETVVGVTDFDAARKEGFQRLAGYIFGGNVEREKIAMTTPVDVRAKAKEGEHIAMTGPVTARDSASGYVVAFTMPRERKLSELPAPEDARVRLRKTRAERVAVLRYRGSYDSETVQEKQAELLFRAGAAGLTPYGEAYFAGYDAPSTLTFLRRVEVWIPVEPVSASIDT
jgi:hypothetical protein